MATVKVEGTSLEMPDEICRTNKSLTDALITFYPGVANAEFKRETKGDETIITVTKKAGTKGGFAHVIRALDEAPESISPVLMLEASQPAKLTTKQLDDALLRSLEDEAEILRIANDLDRAEAQAASIRPVGF